MADDRSSPDASGQGPRSPDLRHLLDSLGDVLTALDREWRLTFLNEAAVETLPEGVDREDALGERLWDLFPELRGSQAGQALREAMEDREPVRVEEYDEARDEWWETRVYPSEEGVSVLQTEVTKTKRVQRETERQRHELQMAEGIAGLGHWTLDLETDEVEWSKGCYAVFGQDPETFDPDFQAFVECLHPDDRERVPEEVQDAVEAREDFESTYRVLHPDGEVRHIQAQGQLEIDESGEPVQMIGTVLDITEARRRE